MQNMKPGDTHQRTLTIGWTLLLTALVTSCQGGVVSGIPQPAPDPVAGITVIDDRDDTHTLYGGIDSVQTRIDGDAVLYQATISGLRENHELTGNLDTDADGDTYFNTDGITRDGEPLPCPGYRNTVDTRSGTIEIRIPSGCLPIPADTSVILTLLAQDPHETANVIYQIADTVTIDTAAD